MRYNQLLIIYILLNLLSVAPSCLAQRIAKVHGQDTYTVTIDNPISLMEARDRCINLAEAKAIVERFGRLVTDISVVSDADINGVSTTAYYDEITSSAKGVWIKNTKEPEISVIYSDNKLMFTAEVWGEAREIVQAPVEFKWSILCGGTTRSYANKTFKNKDRLYISFQTPKDGFIAVYLIESSDEVNVLLPTGSNPPYRVERGNNYVLFDTNLDNSFRPWSMTTNRPKEQNQIVIVFSTKPFDLCVATRRDSRRPDLISSHDFKNWVGNSMKYDPNFCVAKDVITIINE